MTSRYPWSLELNSETVQTFSNVCMLKPIRPDSPLSPRNRLNSNNSMVNYCMLIWYNVLLYVNLVNLAVYRNLPAKFEI